MSEAVEPENVNFEDLIELNYSLAMQLCSEDKAILLQQGISSPPRILERHILETGILRRFQDPVKRNLEPIKKVLAKKYLKNEELEEILNWIKGVHTLAPSFSRELKFIIGRQLYLGGGYYEEIMFLPGELIIRNFIKKYGDPRDMKKNRRVYDRMSMIYGIEDLVVPLVGVDDQNLMITYTHLGKNILQAIKGQGEETAVQIVKDGLEVQLEFACKLTENRKVFRIPLTQRLSINDGYVFDVDPPLKKTLSDMLYKIAPNIPTREKRKLLKRFETGREDKYVMPVDPRTVNTVRDIDEKARVCDLDGISMGSIHHVLYSYLNQIGKVQHREGEFVDFAYEFLCSKKGASPTVEGRNNFRARYNLQKPVENLVQAERHVRRTVRDAFRESTENVGKLKAIANLYFNRALRDFKRLGMDDFADAIVAGKAEAKFNVHGLVDLAESGVEPAIVNAAISLGVTDEILWPGKEYDSLKELEDGEYLRLEEALSLHEHDYASILLRDEINKTKSDLRYQPEKEPLAARAWNHVKWPVGIAAGIAVFVTLVSYLPMHEKVNVQQMLSNPTLAHNMQQRIASKDFDYCNMFGYFNNCDQQNIDHEVAGYLKDYIYARENNQLTIETKLYNRLFGWDPENNPGMSSVYNADSLALRMSIMNGLPPQFFRAAIHASISSRVFAEEARQNGYVGGLILLPMETVREIVSTREGLYSDSYKEKMMQEGYWASHETDLELAAVATQAMTSYLGKGNVSTLYARLFAGNSEVDKAVKKASSDDFADFSPYLNPYARELVNRAVAFHPFVAEDAMPMKDVRWQFNQEYSYEMQMKLWLDKHKL